MEKRKLCLLFGGKSGEHEVSLRSAASIVRHLDSARYQLIPIGIDRQGVWHLQDDSHFKSLSPSVEVLEIKTTDKPVAAVPGKGLCLSSEPLPIDVVFPVLHGTYGEDGTVQGLLEIAGLPYVGAGVLGSSLAMDKEKTKEIWKQAGLPVVNFIVIRDRSSKSIKKIEEALVFPLFVKPATAGSSVGITKVYSPSEILPALNTAFRYDNKVLAEQGIKGREIECAVLGNTHPESFKPGEIIPSHDFYDYNAKYIDPEGAHLKVPAEIPEKIQNRVMSLAIEAFLSAECSGMARVDFFLEKDSDLIFINELNTIPGFTSISMYPKMCEASGLSYPELINRLIDLAVERYAQKQDLTYFYEEIHL